MAQTSTDTLNSLLRGELAATETYQQALAKIDDEPGAADLRRIHLDHREAANTLRQHVRSHGGEPEHGSGSWGAFAKAVEGAAKLFGNTTALRALRQGEQSGLSSYEDALKDESLAPDCKNLIRNTLIAQTRDHLAILDRLIQSK
jgi:uncharacterized protein (TIGR02284 family)